MRKLLYISSLVVFVISLSSCAKDEVESPAEVPAVKALKVDHAPIPADIEYESSGSVQKGPQQINDDGDDEDEGIKSPTGIKTKN